VRAPHRESALTPIALVIQTPPPSPLNLKVERAAKGVRLSWTAPEAVKCPPAPVVLPSPTPAGRPSATPAVRPSPTPAIFPSAKLAVLLSSTPGVLPSPTPVAPPVCPTVVAYNIYRRAVTEKHSRRVGSTSIAETIHLDTPAFDAPGACYFVVSLFAADALLESAPSNEECVFASPALKGAISSTEDSEVKGELKAAPSPSID
jgi:hypothetical protein